MSNVVGTAYVEMKLDNKPFESGLKTTQAAATSAATTMEQSFLKSAIAIGASFAIVNKAVEFTIQMIRKIPDTIKESTLLSARVETLGIVLETVGKNAGYTKKEVFEFAESVKKMGITTAEAYTSVTKFMQAQLDASKTSQLARVAQDAAVIGNINSSEALGRITHGIVTLQPEILRTIGITVNFEQEYQKLATTLNKSAGSLTQAEKQTAALNAVIEKGSQIAGTYEASMGTAGKQMQSMKRYVEEVKLMFGNIFLPVFTDVVMYAVERMKELNKWFEEMSKTGRIQEWGNSIKEALGKGIDYTTKLIEIIKGGISVFVQFKEVIMGVSLLIGSYYVASMLNSSKSVQAMIKSIYALNEAIIANQVIMAGGMVRQIGYGASALEVMKTKVSDLAAGIGKFATGPVGIATLAIAGLTAGITSFWWETTRADREWKEFTKSIDKLKTSSEIAAQVALIDEQIQKARELGMDYEELEKKKAELLGQKTFDSEIVELEKLIETWEQLGDMIDDTILKQKKAHLESLKQLKEWERDVRETTDLWFRQQQAINKKKREDEEEEARNKKKMETASAKASMAEFDAMYKAKEEIAKIALNRDLTLRRRHGEWEEELITETLKKEKDEINRKYDHAVAMAHKEAALKKVSGENEKAIAIETDNKIKLAKIEKGIALERLNEKELTSFLDLIDKKNQAELAHYTDINEWSEESLRAKREMWKKEAAEKRNLLGAPISRSGEPEDFETDNFYRDPGLEHYNRREQEYFDKKAKTILSIQNELTTGLIGQDNYLYENRKNNLDDWYKDITLRASKIISDEKQWYDFRIALDKEFNRRRINNLIEYGKTSYEWADGIKAGTLEIERDMATAGKYGYEITKQSHLAMKESFSSLFADLRNGEMKSWSEYFTDFTNKIASKWEDMLAEMLANWIMTGNMIKTAGMGESASGSGGLMGIAGSFLGGLGSWLGFGGATGTGASTDGYSIVSPGSEMVDWTMGLGFHKGARSVGEGSASFYRFLPSSIFDSAMRYHSGLKANEFAAILEEGETVLPKDFSSSSDISLSKKRNEEIGKSNAEESSSKNVVVQLNNPVFQDLETQRKTMAQIAEVICKKVAPGAIVENYKNDGEVRNIIKGRL